MALSRSLRSALFRSFRSFYSSEVDPSRVVTKYIRVGNETLAAKKVSDKLFYPNDHLGSVDVITSILGALVLARRVRSLRKSQRKGRKDQSDSHFLFFWPGVGQSWRDAVEAFR